MPLLSISLDAIRSALLVALAVLLFGCWPAVLWVYEPEGNVERGERDKFAVVHRLGAGVIAATRVTSDGSGLGRERVDICIETREEEGSMVMLPREPFIATTDGREFLLQLRLLRRREKDVRDWPVGTVGSGLYCETDLPSVERFTLRWPEIVVNGNRIRPEPVTFVLRKRTTILRLQP